MMSAVAYPHGDAPPQADQMQESAARIDALLEATAASGPAAQARAEELVACVSRLYGAGLERMLEILREQGVLSPPVLGALVGDDLVSGLLLVHDLHPETVQTRVLRALDTVRPYLGSHGGDVELVGIDADSVVRLRLTGSCDGCPSSSVTLELAVEGAVQAAAPEVSRIEVEASAPAPGAKPGAVIPLASLRARIDGPDQPRAKGTWVPVPELSALQADGLAGFDVDGVTVCACRIGREVFCFRDRCGHCGESLAGAVIERRLGDPAGTGVLRCGQCRSHFDVRRAGAGIDDPSEHLDPLPVLIGEHSASIAIPAAAP